jgi:hypothetical protein
MCIEPSSGKKWAENYKAEQKEMSTRGGRRRFFCAFAVASAKRKKERESAKKKEREKKRKRRARKKKSANSRFFLNPQWKSGFRAQSRSAGGKSKGLE